MSNAATRPFTLDEYQQSASRTAVYPARNQFHGILYTSVALAGEVGEFCNLVKKVARNHDGVPPLEMIEAMSEELGDVLWYVSQAAVELGLSLDQIAVENLAKLSRRKEENKLKEDQHRA